MYNELKQLQRIEDMKDKICPNCGNLATCVLDEDDDSYCCKECGYEGSLREDADNEGILLDSCEGDFEEECELFDKWDL